MKMKTKPYGDVPKHYLDLKPNFIHLLTMTEDKLAQLISIYSCKSASQIGPST